MTQPGVFRSDLDGHLFVLKLHPVSLTCVVCMETCDRSNFKNNPSFKTAAATFTSKHGYLDERIANDFAEIIPPRTMK